MECDKTCLRLYALLAFMVPCLGVMAAFEPAGEKTHLLAEGQGWKPRKVLWGYKINEALAVQDQAMVVYLPKGGAQYCLTCDLRDEKTSEFYIDGLASLCLIRPLSDVLKDQFLKGYILKEDQENPCVNAAFGLKDANLSHCVPYRFLSETLKYFLRKYCSVLALKGKVSFDDGIKRFTKDMREKIVPLFQELRWTIVAKDCFLEAVEKDTRENKALIFIVLGTEGVLCGQWERKFITLGQDRPTRSLYDFKMIGSWGELKSKYPYSRAAHAQCVDAR